jgi:isochorismate hydrolase
MLVLDMQEYFLNPGFHAYLPASRSIKGEIYRLAGHFCRRSRPVICTRHVNDPRRDIRMAAWWSELLTRDHPGAGFAVPFPPPDSRIMEKSQYDAFLYTDLQDRLRQTGTKQVVICGVMTHLCCESTARSAFMRGFEVFFTVDGTATLNRDFHRAALRTIGHGFSHLVSVQQVEDWMGGDR